MSAETRSRSGCGRPAWALLCALGLVFATACGDDDDDEGKGDAGGGDSERFEGCDTIIKKGSNAEKIQTALIEAKTKSTLCFEDGVYKIDSELSLSVNEVTVRGNPKDR